MTAHATCNEYRTVFIGGGDVHVCITDPRVLQLAHAVYRRYSPYTPLETYQYVLDRDLSTSFPIFDGKASVEYALDPSDLLRFRDAHLHHFPADLVAEFAKELEKQSTTDMVVGDRRRAFTFTRESDAQFAVAYDAIYRKTTGCEIVAFLVRCLSHPLKRFGMQNEALPSLELKPADIMDTMMESRETGFVSGIGCWMELTENIKAISLRRAAHIVALHGKVAITLTIVYHHWQVIEPTVLSHRLAVGCTLSVAPNALTGGHFILSYTHREREQWPWWMSAVTLRVHSVLLPIIMRKEPMHRVRLQPSLKHSLTDLLPPDNKRLRTVIDKWTKSTHSIGISSPYLCRLISPPESFSDDILSARRIVNKEDCEACGVIAIFKDEFGYGYTNEVLQRTLVDDMAAIYIVERDLTDDGCVQPIAAFVLLLYEAVFFDGGVGTACMIDSFAVQRAVQGQGIGGQVFHKLCRGIAKYRSHLDMYNRHVMFAQCLNTKRPRDFWFDKLDDSGMARALLLQASIMSPERIPIHVNCCARGRVYHEEVDV